MSHARTKGGPKTPEIRAIELFRLVHGPGDSGNEAEFRALNPALRRGWIKLGKHVLSVENKWARVKPYDTPRRRSHCD